jgi:hypothetical protein
VTNDARRGKLWECGSIKKGKRERPMMHIEGSYGRGAIKNGECETSLCTSWAAMGVDSIKNKKRGN